MILNKQIGYTPKWPFSPECQPDHVILEGKALIVRSNDGGGRWG